MKNTLLIKFLLLSIKNTTKNVGINVSNTSAKLEVAGSNIPTGNPLLIRNYNNDTVLRVMNNATIRPPIMSLLHQQIKKLY